jgi:hypothetical protein
MGWLLLGIFLYFACAVLIVAEIFVPSGGLISICALGCLIGGFALFYNSEVVSAWVGIVLAFVEIPIVLIVSFKIFPNTRFGKTVTLVPPDRQEGDAIPDTAELEELLGGVGKVVTPLRPVGMVDFSGNRIECVAEGGYVEKDKMVKVIKVETMPMFFVSVLIVIGIVILISFLLISKLMGFWMQAYFAQANIKFVELVGMRIRKVDPKIIVKAKIMGIQAGLDLTTNELESHYLAGGDVSRLVAALIKARHGDVDLTFRTAASIDLAGRDVLAEVKALVKSTETSIMEQEDEQEVEESVFEDEEAYEWPES